MSNFFNQGVALSSKKDDWETPQVLFDELNNKYHFTWDLAATALNYKVSNYFTPAEDSLKQDWSKLSGNLFLNPPYGRDLKFWVKKAYESQCGRNGGVIVLIIPARTDTSYWHDFIFHKAEIKFLRGRLKFEVNGKALNSAPFGSAIVVYGALKGGDEK